MKINPDSAFTLWTLPAATERVSVDSGRGVSGDGWSCRPADKRAAFGVARFMTFPMGRESAGPPRIQRPRPLPPPSIRP